MTILFIGCEDIDFEVNSTLSRNTSADDANFGRDNGPIAPNSGGLYSDGVYNQASFTKQTSYVSLAYAAYLGATTATANRQILVARDNALGAAIFEIANSSSNDTYKVRRYDTSGVVADVGSTFTLSQASVLRINVEYNRHASTGYLRIYVAGLQVFETTGDTIWGGNSATGVDAFRFANNGNACLHTEVVVADTSTLQMKVATLVKTGAGNYTAWTGTFADVDEAILDPSDVIYSGTGGQRISFTLSDLSATADDLNVLGVYQVSYAKKGATGPQNLQHSLRISSTDYDSSNLNPTSAYTRLVTEWLTNPATSAAWTAAAVNALEPGYESIT